MNFCTAIECGTMYARRSAENELRNVRIKNKGSKERDREKKRAS